MMRLARSRYRVLRRPPNSNSLASRMLQYTVTAPDTSSTTRPPAQPSDAMAKGSASRVGCAVEVASSQVPLVQLPEGGAGRACTSRPRQGR